jgi:Amidohydrolase family
VLHDEGTPAIRRQHEQRKATCVAPELASVLLCMQARPSKGRAMVSKLDDSARSSVNNAQPQAEAVAVKGGKILGVGTRAQIETLKDPSTVVQDLGGKTLLPGFIDGHSHLSGVGLQTVAANLLPPPDGTNDSIAALQKSLRAWMTTSNVPKAYGIIIGFGSMTRSSQSSATRCVRTSTRFRPTFPLPRAPLGAHRHSEQQGAGARRDQH